MKPNECDAEIFEKGEPIVIMHFSDDDNAEGWIKKVAEEANAQVDWHVSGGRVQVLHLGDSSSRERVVAAINRLEGELEALGGIILRDVPPGGAGLYRAGITPVPEGTLAYDPEFGPMIKNP